MPYYVIRSSPIIPGASGTVAIVRHRVDTLKDARAKADALPCDEGEVVEIARVHDRYVAERGPIVKRKQAVADEPEVVATEPAPSVEPAVAS